jgi:hypothetical protein
MSKQFAERMRVLVNCHAPPQYSGRFGFIEAKDGRYSWKVRLEGSDKVILFHEDEIDEVLQEKPSDDCDAGCCA